MNKLHTIYLYSSIATLTIRIIICQRYTGRCSPEHKNKHPCVQPGPKNFLFAAEMSSYEVQSNANITHRHIMFSTECHK